MQLEAENVGLRQHFTVLTARIAQFVWTSAENGHWFWASPRWTNYTGQTPEMSRGKGWVGAIHPDDRSVVEAAWQEASIRGVLDVEHRVLSLDPSRETRWFRTFATPLPQSQGKEREWLGICTDVHETRLLEQQHRLQLDTLQWRVCNVLALIRSVARRTAKASDSVEDFALHLDSRLDAIARTQTLMLQDIKAEVGLEDLVTDALLAHAAHDSERIRVTGPPLRLQGKVAELFGLAMHELAMNAVEHGAFGEPVGRVAITWHVERTVEDVALCFEWLETEVSTSGTAPRHKGFGTELIGRTLEDELGATASIEIGPRDVRCTIRLPIANLATASDPQEQASAWP